MYSKAFKCLPCRAAFIAAALGLLAGVFTPPPAAAETTILPLPVYATSRNGGDEYGVMPVFLLKDDEYIYGIVAPSAIYNENTGLNLTFRYLGYPTVDRNYAIFINKAIGVDHEATGEYLDKNFMGERYRLFARLTYFRDSTYRFFGFTEQSREEDEVNYSNVEFSPEVSMGRYLPNNLTLTLREKFRWVYIRRGKLDKLPYLKSSGFNDIDGVNGDTVLNSRLSISYDTRDDEVYPSEGMRAELYGELNHAFSDGVWYTRGGFELKKFFALDSKRYVTVLKLAAEITGGDDVPFFERSRLGGENSLRGYGRDRFIDDGFILVNIEERIRLFKLHIFGVWSDWEAAPFVDIGRVYGSFGKDFFKHYQINPGIGFRAIVEPNVVGRVDLGYSEEGLTAFVGLNFPF